MLFKHPHKVEAKECLENLVTISTLSYLIAERHIEPFQDNETLAQMGNARYRGYIRGHRN
jgi:hypothetical protein